MKMATTIDSGTETLFSDESPCELVRSPSICSGDERELQMDDTQSINSRLAPPNIQPYSGVLEKGKVVIRPIAFKPSAMTPSSRFGIAGERYGSTPILTRPGSRLTLYGSSSDIHHQSHSMNNYSLDRKLRSFCPSTCSSPRLEMSSLSSLPHSHKLVNYDSLESVRKSPVSNADSSVTHKPSYQMSSNHSSLVDLTPSPSDSGISELEAALRYRDSEVAYLRQTMEHNEQVIFRVYQEKEKVWERELRRLKTVQESRLRTSAQKVQKLEQMLMMQTYQLQQDKKRLSSDVQRSNMQCDRLRQEIDVLRNRLEETEWGLCQKTGELSLLKTQLKESQIDQTTKCQELVQLRTDHRELRDQLEENNKQIHSLESSNASKDEEIIQLKEELLKVTSSPPPQYDSLDSNNKNQDLIEKLNAEIMELRGELSEKSLSYYNGVEAGRGKRGPLITEEESLEDLEIQKFNGHLEVSEAEKLRKELEMKSKQFEKERMQWAKEKEKVLTYQSQLRLNYVQMLKRTSALEEEIENLTLELELERTGLKKKLELSQTIEL